MAIFRNYDIMGVLDTLKSFCVYEPKEFSPDYDETTYANIRKRIIEKCQKRIEGFMYRNLVQYHTDEEQCFEELERLWKNVFEVIEKIDVNDNITKDVYSMLIELSNNISEARLYCIKIGSKKFDYYKSLADLTNTDAKKQLNFVSFKKNADYLASLFDTKEQTIEFVKMAKEGNAKKSKLAKLLCNSSGFKSDELFEHDFFKNDIYNCLVYFLFDCGNSNNFIKGLNQ